MPQRYNPPTRVATISMPLRALVIRAEPDHERLKHREIEYEFTNKVFRGDPDHRGAYADD